MAKPILFSVNAFDKSNAHDFPFSYQGNQAFKNKLTIYNSTTNEVVYSQEQITMQLQHTLPADTLQNGVCYTAEIAVYDRDGNTSPTSDKIIFYCFSTPSFHFSNLSTNQIVRNSSIDLVIEYEQPENEPLVTYQAVLYDYTKTPIYESGVQYSVDSMHFMLSDLTENAFYYVQATGVTLNGMEITTGFIEFSVEYARPSVWNKLITENLYHQGIIKLSSHIVSIIGTSNPDPPVYIDDEMVDLREDDSWVRFDEGFQITDDFTLWLKGRDFQPNKEILIMSNGDAGIYLDYCVDRFNGQDAPQAFAALSVYNSITRYYLTSNFIEVPDKNTMITLWLRRKGCLYSVKIETSEGGTD